MDGKDYRKHKVLMGIGVMIFATVLYLFSSDASLEANLNWPFAFFVLGALLIVKAFVFPCCKK